MKFVVKTLVAGGVSTIRRATMVKAETRRLGQDRPPLPPTNSKGWMADDLAKGGALQRTELSGAVFIFVCGSVLTPYLKTLAPC